MIHVHTFTNRKIYLQVCERVCIYSMISEECGCYHPYYLDHPAWEGKYGPCNLTAHSKLNKTVNVFQTFCFIKVCTLDYFNLFQNYLLKIPSVLAKDADCAHVILQEIEEERRKCSCYVDCDEQNYLPTISGSTFPAAIFSVSSR